MKKYLKIFIIIISLVFGIILLDTLQARLFKHSPLLSIKESLNDKSYVDKGILINTFYCINDDVINVSWHFKTAKFTCPIYSVVEIDLKGLVLEVTDNYVRMLSIEDNSFVESGSQGEISLSNKPKIVGSDKLKEGQIIELHTNTVKERYPALITTDEIKVVRDVVYNENKNISMKIKDNTLTREGVTIVITDTSSEKNTYGISYTLEKKVNDEWEPVKTIIEGDYIWTLQGYYVDKNNKLEMDIDFDTLYGSLDNGTYRIIKTCSPSKFYLYNFITVEFVIDDNVKNKVKELKEIVDNTLDDKDFACSQALEEIYQDDNYTYYFNCIKSNYVIVKYTDNTSETVKNALKKKRISIEDLDKYNIKYLKEAK